MIVVFIEKNLIESLDVFVEYAAELLAQIDLRVDLLLYFRYIVRVYLKVCYIYLARQVFYFINGFSVVHQSFYVGLKLPVSLFNSLYVNISTLNEMLNILQDF